MTGPRRLGRFGPVVLPIGLGTFSFSHAYGQADERESIATLLRALELRCTLIDTADSYGAGANEEWLGRTLQPHRHQVVLCTKVGLVCDRQGKVIGRNGRPEYILNAVDASLRRLRTQVLDVCTLHRPDPAVPIEDSVGALAEAVRLGKVRQVGLSEVTPDELQRAHSVHPIAALQSEYSLWTRDPEAELIPLCARLGIVFVAFSPLGRGMFAGLRESKFEPSDFRSSLPRFQGGNLKRNLALVEQLTELADRKECSPGQLALAWVMRAGEHVFAIPGTRTRSHLEENVQAVDIGLTVEDMQELHRTFSPAHIAGERYPQGSVFNPQTS